MRHAIVTLVMLAAPRAALACPVCFGQNDSPMASAANLSILVMLIITGGVLAAFASFFVYLMRRARLMADASDPAAPPADRLRQGYGGPPKQPAEAEARRFAQGRIQGSNPNEGTAQC